MFTITNTAWVRARLCILQKGCTRLAAASDKVYHLLAHGRWFSLGTLTSSTTKTGHHDIAEILLKLTLKHQKSKQLLVFLAVVGVSAHTYDVNKALSSTSVDST